MRLVADGAFALDEPVDRLLPELADRRVLRSLDVSPSDPARDTVACRAPDHRRGPADDAHGLRLRHRAPMPHRRPDNDPGLNSSARPTRSSTTPDQSITSSRRCRSSTSPTVPGASSCPPQYSAFLVARARSSPLDLADRLLAPLGTNADRVRRRPRPSRPSVRTRPGRCARRLQQRHRQPVARPAAFPNSRDGLIAHARGPAPPRGHAPRRQCRDPGSRRRRGDDDQPPHARTRAATTAATRTSTAAAGGSGSVSSTGESGPATAGPGGSGRSGSPGRAADPGRSVS